AHPVALRCPDLEDDAPIASLAGFDVVVHAAGPRVHPGLGWGDYLREHVGTTTRVARSMRPGAHLVLVSSAAVYGSGRGEVTGETAPRPDTFPVPAYAWAKLAAEHAARGLATERGVALTVLRPSIIYGPGAGGVLITLRDLARRGLRVELMPRSTRQHLLHIRLLQRVLEGLIAAPAPERAAAYVVADPFVVPTSDLNAAYAEAGPRAARVPVPIGLVAGALRGWQRRSQREAPGAVAVAAMLGLDNVYDVRPCLERLEIDPREFGRPTFDAFLKGSP
ncbi:MAG: NAD-dependent epimerase/dehydratase family protein, partial [Candidatus Rokuibacteriota bacterium]